MTDIERKNICDFYAERDMGPSMTKDEIDALVAELVEAAWEEGYAKGHGRSEAADITAVENGANSSKDALLAALRSLQGELAAMKKERDFQYCDGCNGYECSPEKGCAYPGAAPATEQREAVTDARTHLLEDIALCAKEWCDAVDRDTSWDGWDHHFKAMKWELLPRLATVRYEARAALEAALNEGKI